MLPPGQCHEGNSASSLALSPDVTHGETLLRRAAEWDKLTPYFSEAAIILHSHPDPYNTWTTFRIRCTLLPGNLSSLMN